MTAWRLSTFSRAVCVLVTPTIPVVTADPGMLLEMVWARARNCGPNTSSAANALLWNAQPDIFHLAWHIVSSIVARSGAKSSAGQLPRRFLRPPYVWLRLRITAGVTIQVLIRIHLMLSQRTSKYSFCVGATLLASVLFAQQAPEPPAWGMKAIHPPKYAAPNKP